jgi:hypothetical protein
LPGFSHAGKFFGLQSRFLSQQVQADRARKMVLLSGCSSRDLMALGPFPEPLLGGSQAEAQRWSRKYRSRLVREDVADLGVFSWRWPPMLEFVARDFPMSGLCGGNDDRKLTAFANETRFPISAQV